MDDTLLALVTQMKLLTDSVNKLMERVDRYALELDEFSDRFEEVMESYENERRLDRLEYN